MEGRDKLNVATYFGLSIVISLLVYNHYLSCEYTTNYSPDLFCIYMGIWLIIQGMYQFTALFVLIALGEDYNWFCITSIFFIPIFLYMKAQDWADENLND